MTADELARLKNKLLIANRPGSQALDAWAVEFHHFLDEPGLFKSIKIKKTGELSHLIEVRCRPLSANVAISQIMADVERIWLENLCIFEIEGHTLTFTTTEGVLDFVCGTRQGAGCVTGKIIVSTPATR